MDEASLLKYFSSNTSDEESRHVEEWIEQSADNRKLAEDIFYLYFSIQTFDVINSIDTEKALKTVKTKISRNRRKKLLFNFQRVAAVLLIPILGILTFYIYKSYSDTKNIQYVEMKANSGMTSMLTLPDGSKVSLNANSKIKYPTQFGKERFVELEGEAFFEVVKDPQKKFIVSTKEGLFIEVLGTKFNVEAYNNKNITTTLVEGKIELQYNNTEKILMKPSQKVVYDIDNHTVTLKNKSSVRSDIAWKDGEIIFEDTSLDDALNILSKHFDVEFIVENNSLYDNFFTGKFSDQSLDIILKHISISSNIKHRITTENNKKTVRLY